MDIKIEKAVRIIKKIEYINIASITPEGFPWNTPVYTAFDKNLNFYWYSWKKNQHSINVRNNHNVFVTIYDSTVAPGITAEGVYFIGKAYELDDPKEIMTGLTLIFKRLKLKVMTLSKFINTYPSRVYKFTPEKFWMNYDGYVNKNMVDMREELDIRKIKKNI